MRKLILIMSSTYSSESHSIIIPIVMLWLSILNIHAQAISGQVLALPDSTLVPFASLTNQTRQWGQSTRENGTFTLDRLKVEDTLIVSSIGYHEIRIPYYELHDNIKLYLTVRPVQLSEVKIKKKRISRTLWLGSKEKSSFASLGSLSTQDLQQVALFIPNAKQFEGYITKVGYWVTSLGKARTPFRVRIYKNEGGKPGEDLLTQSLIAKARRSKAWLDVDVSEFDILFPPNGFFVAMEWLVVPDKRYWSSVKWPDGHTEDRFGQSIGVVFDLGHGGGHIRKNGGDWQEWQDHFKNQNSTRPMFRAQVKIYE